MPDFLSCTSLLLCLTHISRFTQALQENSSGSLAANCHQKSVENDSIFELLDFKAAQEDRERLLSLIESELTDATGRPPARASRPQYV